MVLVFAAFTQYRRLVLAAHDITYTSLGHGTGPAFRMSINDYDSPATGSRGPQFAIQAAIVRFSVLVVAGLLFADSWSECESIPLNFISVLPGEFGFAP